MLMLSSFVVAVVVVGIVVLASWSAIPTSAIFVEQKGDMDWTWRSIGFVRNAHDLTDRKILTFSQNKVFSLISKDNGNKIWRVIIPANEKILQYGVDSGSLYVATQVDGLNKGFKISSFRVDDGLLRWDTAIKKDGSVAAFSQNSTSTPFSFCDLKVDHPTHVILLVANKVILINKSSGLASYQILPQSIKLASGVKEGSVMLAKLVSNTFIDKIEFMGCISDRNDDYVYDDKCSHMITVTHFIKDKELLVKSYELANHLSILDTKWLYNGNFIAAVSNFKVNNKYTIQDVLTFELLQKTLEPDGKISPSVIALPQLKWAGNVQSFELYGMNNNRNHAKYTAVRRCYENDVCRLDVLTRGEKDFNNKAFEDCDNVFVLRSPTSLNRASTVTCVKGSSIKVTAISDSSSLEARNAEYFKTNFDSNQLKDLHYITCSQGYDCVWQYKTGLFSAGKSLDATWSLQEGLVDIRNIVFPRDGSAYKLDNSDSSFKNRMDLQNSTLDDIKGLFNATKVKKDIPLFAGNQALIIAGASTNNIRLALSDAFTGDIFWVINLAFSFNPEAIVSSKLVLMGDAVTVVIKGSSNQDYIGNFVLNQNKKTPPKFSGFSRVDYTINEVISYDESHLISLGKGKADSLVLHNLATAVGKDKLIEITGNKYFHIIDSNTGSMKIYRASSMNAISETANIQFPTSEKIVAKAYVDSSVKVHSEFIVAGDDNVMTKYLNPNMVGIVTATNNENSCCTENYSNGPQYFDDFSVVSPTMSFYLVDTISGRFIHRISIKYGSAPVHMVLIENSAVITYWNWKAKRSELLSIAYFDGRLDKYDLHPFKSSSNEDILDMNKRSNFSSFKSTSPLAIHKTFILPHSVIGIGCTKTHKGITNKQVLLAFATGQLYSLGLREINPRRPHKDPTNFELQEGLMKYSAFIYPHGLSFVTLDDKLEYIRDNNVLIAVKPTKLESSAIVLSHWGGLDSHGAIVTPSQGYDTLSSDFNSSLLLMLICGLGTAVFVIKNQVDRKKLKMLWA